MVSRGPFLAGVSQNVQRFPLQDLKTGRAMNPTRMAGVSSQTGGVI